MHARTTRRVRRGVLGTRVRAELCSGVLAARRSGKVSAKVMSFRAGSTTESVAKRKEMQCFIHPASTHKLFQAHYMNAVIMTSHHEERWHLQPAALQLHQASQPPDHVVHRRVAQSRAQHQALLPQVVLVGEAQLELLPHHWHLHENPLALLCLCPYWNLHRHAHPLLAEAVVAVPAAALAAAAAARHHRCLRAAAVVGAAVAAAACLVHRAAASACGHSCGQTLFLDPLPRAPFPPCRQHSWGRRHDPGRSYAGTRPSPAEDVHDGWSDHQERTYCNRVDTSTQLAFDQRITQPTQSSSHVSQDCGCHTWPPVLPRPNCRSG